ncbi:cellulose binding domain-containing protein, partial [Mycolicibacterium mucogenicum]
MTGPDSRVKHCRAALHVVVSALTVIVLGLAGSPVAHAAAAGARFVVQHTWQDGFIARFVVTNYSTVPMADWKIEFDMPRLSPLGWWEFGDGAEVGGDVQAVSVP